MSESNSLFEQVAVESPAATAPEDVSLESVAPSAEWHFADGVPGQGEAPEYFDKSRFKSVSEQARAYRQLEKKFSMAEGAPEKYEFSEGYELPEDDPHIAELLNFAKENRIPNKVMDRMIQDIHHYIDQFVPDTETERAKLGEHGKERIQAVWNWAQQNLQGKRLETVKALGHTAEGVELIEEFMKMSETDQNIPTGGAVQGSNIQQPALTVEGFRSEIAKNHKEYMENDHYRDELKRKYASVFTSK